ncbi:GRP family sugar transporter [Bifidobacterium animalis]|uniref:GRP family sugar transporter n=1 Tax=Bifidobacterium animalis TaxID=28025 RepID=UPI002556B6E9|nr:GRP family sugar transporter [Bifidobacterium animalis]WKX23959.1 GRP family sugar transporter [Bifidobacterium animalis subsp. lactis]
MGMLIALLPALFLGSNSVMTAKIDGKPSQGTLGATFGAFLFAVLMAVCYTIPHAGASFAFNPRIWVVGLCSGIFWTIGSIGQFSALKPLGVSLAMPISTAGQVVGNALMAAIVLGEWRSLRVWVIGIIAIILVTSGAILCSARDSVTDAVHISAKNMKFGMIALLISTIGFMMYFVFPNLLHKTGYIDNAIYNAPDGNGLYYMTAMILPQSVGQVLAAVAIIVLGEHNQSLIFTRKTALNIFTGLSWAIGNCLIFISAANPNVGQAIATTFSQLGVLVSTFGGIVILKEHKTRHQMICILFGTLLIVAGAVLMAMYTTT